ncbi:MAG: hypothetical protein HKN76_22845 [Saprospiraceae bacterium]|nr:hypothetical protein [Saprospiraceae bacterium]
MRFFNSVLVVIASLIYFQIAGQEAANPSPYLLDSFVDGTLYYAGKPPREAKFNYHLVGQEIVMDFNEKKVPVNNFPNLDSVRIGPHNFILIDGKSYELLINDKFQLLLEYRYTSQQQANEGLYGTKSHTQGVVVANKSLKPNDFYSLKWHKGYELVDRSEFFIWQEGEMQKFGNVNQLAQIFKNKKKEIKEFASKNKSDFSRIEDVEKIVRFAATI